MKTKPLSVGIFCLLFVMGCSIQTKDRVEPGEESGKASSTALPEELSYKQDRAELEELRKNIPEPIKSDNDLLRENLALLGKVDKHPRKHRDKFDKLLRKIRNKYTKKTRKQREDFRKAERKRRDAFMKAHKEKRKDFLDDKPDRETQREFFREHEAARREFKSNERDKRQEFEADMREKSKDFSAMVREHRREFYRELRLYEKRYKDFKKQELEQKRARRKRLQQGLPPDQPTEYESLEAGE